MKRWFVIIALVAVGSILPCGHGGRRAVAGPLDEISIPEMRDKVIRAIEGSDKKEPAGKPSEGKEDYRRRIERRLDWLDGRIHQLKIDAARKGRESKARLDQELPDLLRQREAAQKELDRLGDASGSAWQKLRRGVDAAVQKLEDGVNRVGAEI